MEKEAITWKSIRLALRNSFGGKYMFGTMFLVCKVQRLARELQYHRQASTHLQPAGIFDHFRWKEALCKQGACLVQDTCIPHVIGCLQERNLVHRTDEAPIGVVEDLNVLAILCRV